MGNVVISSLSQPPTAADYLRHFSQGLAIRLSTWQPDQPMCGMSSSAQRGVAVIIETGDS